MGYLNTGLNKKFAKNITFCVLAVFCLFAFLYTSCINPFFEQALYLKTITFVTNGGSDVPQQKLLMGEALVRPLDPVKNDYSFAGWSVHIGGINLSALYLQGDLSIWNNKTIFNGMTSAHHQMMVAALGFFVCTIDSSTGRQEIWETHTLNVNGVLVPK